MASSDGTITLETKVDSSGLSAGLSKIKSSAGAGLSSLASGVGKVTKAFGVAAAAATAAFVGISKSAISSYSDYEQLTGGVETLFKSSSDVVMNYANQAYQTAGLSANQYMETVTGFSASLLQSLGGDTAKAAEYGNQAVIDMADNANKMGTSMESIQNAYQGFAKQNYTMLDNLKLGYGGTKEEMQRLLTDAEKISGVKYDISSFADITEAIHVMQTEVGITGTTSQEAATTIQGSVGMMKAAWENLLTGLSNPDADMGTLIQNFVDSVSTAATNLMPAIQTTADSIMQALPSVLDKIIGLIDQLLPSVIQAVMGIINGVVDVLPQLVTSLVGFAPQILDGILQVCNAVVAALPQIIQPIVAALPPLLQQIIAALPALIQPLVAALPQIIQPIVEALPMLVQAIVEALPLIIPPLVEGLVASMAILIAALPQIIQPIIDNLPTIILSITQAIIDNLPLFLEAIGQLIFGIVAALPSLIVALLEAVGGIAVQIGEVLYNTLPEPMQNAFSSAWEAVKAVWDLAEPYFKLRWENIKAIFSVVKDVLGAAFATAWTYIKAVWDTVTGYFSAVWNTIAGIFSVVASVLSGDWSAAWEAIKGIVDTWQGYFQSVWNSIKTVFNSVKTFFKTSFESAWNAVKQVFSNTEEFFNGVWETIKSAFKFDEMGDIGRNIVEGLWNGIDGMTEWIVGKIKSFCSNALGAIKDFFRIESPSRLMRDDVGEMIVAGMAIGIEKSSDKISKAFKSLTEDTRSEVKKARDELYKPLLANEKKYQNESTRIQHEQALKQAAIDEEKDESRKEALKKALDTQKEADKTYLDHLNTVAQNERKIYEARAKDVENLQKKVVDAYSEMSISMMDSIEDLEAEQAKFADKLAEYGDLTETITAPNGNTITRMANFDKQIKFLEEYERNLLTIKGMDNVPLEFWETMRDMGVEEGADFAKKLIKLPEKEFQKYITDWQRKQEVSQRISKELYKDEADKLASEISDKFKTVEKEFFSVGEDAAYIFENGFMERIKYVIDDIREVIGSAFSRIIPSNISYELGAQAADVPALARGAVIPPNRKFMAVLGDQKNGKNLEAPAELIKQMVDKSLDERGVAVGNQQVIKEEHYVLDKTELMTIIYRLAKNGERLNGTSLVNGGAY